MAFFLPWLASAAGGASAAGSGAAAGAGASAAGTGAGAGGFFGGGAGAGGILGSLSGMGGDGGQSGWGAMRGMAGPSQKTQAKVKPLNMPLGVPGPYGGSASSQGRGPVQIGGTGRAMFDGGFAGPSTFYAPQGGGGGFADQLAALRNWAQFGY